MKYVYGPVRSRRLGHSLGISLVPYKVCQFDCVYCQLKRTTEKTVRRKDYIDKKAILEEVRQFFLRKPAGQQVDYVTFSGSGEPTLHRSIGRLIRRVKEIAQAPVAVITNAAALVDAAVRRDLMAADLIVPSLDAVTQDVFEKIDRPAPGIRIGEIVEALIELRREFKGQIWLEVMLVRGVNDTGAYLKKIHEAARRIRPDRIQLNTPARPPAEAWVKPPTPAALKKAREIFGEDCDIV
jgi:wyosine [tRNA(Phe)-imidazoG37] synthetase (radical SAM superfamily)